MEGDAVVADQYTRMAHVYEERVVPRFAPIAARTVGLAGLRGGERVLDIGCGTGLATLLAAAQVGPQGEVVGVDFSEGQLGMAVAKAQRAGLANARFERLDATKLPFQGEFDAAVSNLGIPADFEPCFEGIRRALKPGGRASICEWETSKSEVFEEFNSALRARMERSPPPDVAAMRAVRARRQAQFDRIGTAERFAAELRKAGFQRVEARPTVYEVPFAGWRDAYDLAVSWGFTEQEVRLLPGPEREGLQKDLEARWGTAPFRARWRLLHATAVR